MNVRVQLKVSEILSAKNSQVSMGTLIRGDNLLPNV
jgi:hypothetical protein